MTMKLSISNIAWTGAEDEMIYAHLKEHGFTGLEIAPTRIFPKNPYENLEQASMFARKLWKEWGLRISSLQSIWFGKQERLFGSEAEREELLVYTKSAILFAEACNCSNLVFGSPKNRVILLEEDGSYQKEQWQIALQFFEELGTFAKEHHTVLAMEPNPPIYQTNFINTTKQAFDLVQEVNNAGFQVNVDLGTLIALDETLQILEEKKQWIHHIHVSEPGLEVIQHRKLHTQLAEVLHKIEYENYISIEMKNLQDITIIKQVIHYVKEVFDGI